MSLRVNTLEPAERTPGMDAYVAAHGDTFAGIYLDHGAGGRVTVLFTGGVADRTAELSQTFPRPDRLVVRQVGHTLGELTAVQGRLGADAHYLAGLGLDDIYTDIAQNAVVVSGPGASAAALSTLQAKYGDLPVQLKPASALVNQGMTGRNSTPFRGGQDVLAYGGSIACTAGFVVQRSGSTFLTTAGHCGSVNTAFYQSGLYIGNESANSRYNGSHSDAAIIPFYSGYSGANINVITPGPTYMAIRGAQGWNGDHIGDYLCMSGRMGDPCGNELSNNATVTIGGVTLYYQRGIGTTYAQSGDSGSAWYQPSGGAGIAMGSQVGSNAQGYAIASQIFDVTSNLNVSVVTCCY